MIETLDDLEATIARMKSGQRLDLEHAFGSLWPRPEFPRADDYLSDRERAERWCRARDCSIRENHDPPKLVIAKGRSGPPSSQSSQG
jgi:hypothetical protein